MSTEFYYNQEVTAAMLNDTAIDLGATSFSQYGTEKFGCAELNKITQTLVSSGVLTSGGALRPVVETDSKGKYIVIQDGTAVFNDGAKYTQSSRLRYGYASSLKGQKIYILNDTANGRAILMRSSTYPTAADYVKIAEISSSGTVTDTRTICSAKVELTSGNVYIEKTLTPSGTSASATFTADEWARKNYLMIMAKGSHLSTDDFPTFYVSVPLSLALDDQHSVSQGNPFSAKADSDGNIVVRIFTTSNYSGNIKSGKAILV